MLIGNNTVIFLPPAGTIVEFVRHGDAGVFVCRRGTDVCRVSFAEVLPKTIAALYPGKSDCPSGFLLARLQMLMMPLVCSLLSTITRLLMRLMG